MLRCVNEGDTVVVEALATGANPDGVHYETPFLCIFETRDGLIVSMREYSDTRAADVHSPRWTRLTLLKTLISALFG